MNKVLSLVLRSLGFNRPKPTTRLGRYLRSSERVLSILGLCYLGLHAFPQAVFAHSVSAHDITLYSREPLPADAAIACLDRAAGLLARSELAVPNRHEKIFLCDSPSWFRFFGPMSGDAFAFSMPLTDNVFIASADCPSDTARSSAPVHNVRSFSSVVAHEITHGLIRHRLGLWQGVRLPSWVAEGYCEYVARESSFPETEGMRLLASDQSDPSGSFRYFLDRRMVTHLMDDQHLSFVQVVARADDAAAIEADTRRASGQRLLLDE